MKSRLHHILSFAAFSVPVLLLSVTSARAAFGTINNDAWKTSTNGNTVYAHAGYIAKFGSTYYWYGEKYQGSVTYHDSGTVNSDTTFICVNRYTSTDLINWSAGKGVLTPGGNIASSDFLGRVAGVLFNASSGKYIMWVRYVGAKGSGELCCTSTSPDGPFVWDHLQTSIPNVYNGTAGDASIFIDSSHGGAPYFICSDAHGRQHAYVCPLSSDYKTIDAATLIATWPSGQEGNSMFYSNASGRYYYITSETNGYSYSQAYEVHSTSRTSGFSADASLNGTVSTHTYYSQVCKPVTLVGSSGTVYMMMCDRWADFNSSYKNAGHGIGYNVWEPITATSTTPTFNALSSWQLDAAAGTWK